MFKALRDRLRRVSKDLEDEVGKQLEAQLEAELEASVAASEGGAAAAHRGDATSDDRAGTTDEAPPGAQGDDGPSPVVRAEGDDHSPPGAHGSDADAVAAAGPAAVDEAASKNAPPAAHQNDRPVQQTGSGSDAGAARGGKAGTRAAHERPRPAVTGRRRLTAQEIESRLERELGEAVQVQRDVEQTASTGQVARFSINEEVLDDVLWELEVALMESDVALPVVEAIKGNVKEQLLSMAVARGAAHDIVERALRTAIKRVLQVGAMDFDTFVRDRLASDKRPVVVMFVGVNGTGKTTTIARIAHRLKEQGVSSVMAAGDTFRAGAIEQLSQHGDKLGIKVIKHSAGADPAAVAYDAIEHARARQKDVVLLDTAGRMQTNRNLMDEMEKIRRVAKPDLVVFVGDSLAGNDAVEQARQFDEVVDIDGAVLTKVDADAKGGAALSVAYTIQKPLLFIGVGQGYGDLEPFDAEKMVERLFGDAE